MHNLHFNWDALTINEGLSHNHRSCVRVCLYDKCTKCARSYCVISHISINRSFFLSLPPPTLSSFPPSWFKLCCIDCKFIVNFF